MNHSRYKNDSLKRKRNHRISMMANMASSLIKKKRIFTTLSKAKTLRRYIEPIITKSKIDNLHSRRIILSYLRDKIAVKELFNNNIFNIVRKRNGGYTRILKSGFRLGDNAIIAFMELVDFNENSYISKKKHRKPTRRSKKKYRIEI